MSQSKIDQLVEITGEDAFLLAERGTFDGVAEGICMNEGCEYTATVEPDCRNGYCEECGTESVKSIVELYLF